MFGGFGFGQGFYGQGSLGGTSPVVVLFDGVIVATLTFAGDDYSSTNLNAFYSVTDANAERTTTGLLNRYTTTDANTDYDLTFKE